MYNIVRGEGIYASYMIISCLGIDRERELYPGIPRGDLRDAGQVA